MLKSLYIENIVLIENANIQFGNSMNCITGDSGSGKSVILESIGIITGDRASQNLIKEGKEMAIVCAEFDISSNISIMQNLQLCGYETTGELIIKKVIKKDSSSRIFINEIVTSVSFVKNLMNELINIHGQTDQLTLLNGKSHIKILDDYINIHQERSEIGKIYQEYKDLSHKRNELINEINIKGKNIQDLQGAKEEIEKYEIYETEERELVDKRIVFLKSKKIIDFIDGLLSEMSNIKIKSIVSKIAKNLHNFADIKEVYEKCNNISEALVSIEDNIDNISSQLHQMIRDIKDNADFNIDEIEERIDIIKSISQKYHTGPFSVFEFLQNTNSELEAIEELKLALNTTNRDIESKTEEYYKLSKQISDKRTKNATKISEAVNKILARLDMHNAEFKIDVQHTKEQISQDGSDKVMFLARLNNSGKFSAIQDIASGGEISRIILAIKASMLGVNKQSCMFIFDEIETGLSSNITTKVATELYNMSNNCQIIAITHNPYIAGIAQWHIKVQKNNVNSIMRTQVKNLIEDERINEIAGMISSDINKNAILMAKSILNKEVFNFS